MSGVLVERIMTIAKSTLSGSTGRHDIHPDDALVEAGFTSLDLANLMIAIEADFDLMIPSASLTPENFRSVHSIASMMASIMEDRCIST